VAVLSLLRNTSLRTERIRKLSAKRKELDEKKLNTKALIKTIAMVFPALESFGGFQCNHVPALELGCEYSSKP
jgi:hypothetical protein